VVAHFLISRCPLSLLPPSALHIDHTHTSLLIDDTILAHRRINSVCFNPDGTLLATGADDHKISVRFSPSHSLTHYLPYRLLLDSVLFPQFSLIHGLCFLSPPHLSLEICISLPHHSQIWDIANKRILSIFDGHGNSVSSLDFSRDGRLLVSGSSDNTVRIWNVVTGQHKMLSIRVPGDVRVIVTYRRV
jgi:WD40 repeat protein